ncbi:MAG: methyltransferase domain-containing protein [Rhodospirillales bacterium]|nr:class I SAM-dependent methyltransferase [Rhodospirillales bacterium]MDE2199222.1 methyltransferase domain-containing protein [Rhodospirillales bacterium]MDE2573694.1 methyltransferase domain-containing protein [Rhodospirillales bacterium]
MGVDLYVFNFLLAFAEANLGDALCLGRQGLHISQQNGQWDAAQAILERHDPGRALGTLVSQDGFAETFLRYIGCRTVLSMDYSPFEGAEIIYDLNKPVPKGLWGRFDVIIDSGTLEHIFNLPIAFQSIKRMLRPGGLFLSINAANNQLGHGFYQFSPELFWRVFAPETGFAIEKMQLVPMSGSPAPINLHDPAGHRQQMEPNQTATYIMAAARRVGTALVEPTGYYQSDYAAGWKAHQA